MNLPLQFAPRNYADLQRYLPAFLERAVESARKRRSPIPQIPLAYESWIGYLCALEEQASVSQFHPEDLTEEEARGLALFRRARERFWQEHEKCPQCNSLNPVHALFCGGCGKSFR